MTEQELKKQYADAIISFIMQNAQQHICAIEERLISLMLLKKQQNTLQMD